MLMKWTNYQKTPITFGKSLQLQEKGSQMVSISVQKDETQRKMTYIFLNIVHKKNRQCFEPASDFTPGNGENKLP